ncbi:methyl-accepting chemotaxis protein [Stieleria sp. JC731]|uniref:methyl-accepting chemotaxis protein n=1 Tax=Pirellulaceae TaxID=2691357 RepID=UPI001E48A411|nr:methyl-accepting chemotaxis protein [Stieleria sp. JC731]MCC9603819.1 methyl-accepting chemotaxis protein [Stieleria sp. JC731]
MPKSSKKLGHIRWYIAAIPLVCLLGMTLQVFMISSQSSDLASSNAATNLSGRQRMLNQRHTRELLQIADGDAATPDKTYDLLIESISLLRHGGEHEFGQLDPADAKTSEALNLSLAALEHKKKIADEYIASLRSGDESRVANLRTMLIAQTDDAHKAAHSVVTTIGDQTAEASQSSFYSVVGGAIAITLVCFAVSMFCSRKSVGVLAKASDSIGSTGDVAQNVSTSAESLRGAIEQFEASIQEIARNATGAASVARNAVDAARSTTETISRLGKSSTEIGEMIRVINSIAEQTNLLALNATIEAARAGEAGKGFAVVANEVKELAAQTGTATEDIVRRIEAIQADTMEATDAIDLVSDIISQINESQNAIAGAVEEQTAMTAEISHNVADLADGNNVIANTVLSLTQLLRDEVASAAGTSPGGSGSSSKAKYQL